MKTLDEVIKAHEFCVNASITGAVCEECPAFAKPDCEIREDALHYLKEYKDYTDTMCALPDYYEWVHSAEPERTAKVKDLERRSETSMSWEGICSNCGSYTMHEMDYCFHCGCRLEWE